MDQLVIEAKNRTEVGKAAVKKTSCFRSYSCCNV